VERAFRSAAAYGCQPAEAGRFWALYDLLTPQECSAYTGRPGVSNQLQRPFRETELGRDHSQPSRRPPERPLVLGQGTVD
jgi:hypothetical protein